MTRFTDRFGCRYPVQMAALGGMASPELAVSISAAGGVGMLSGVGGRDDLERQLRDVPAGTRFGVNFLLPFLDRAAVDLAAREAPLVEFFWGQPDAGLVDQARANGAACGWQVGSQEEARAAVDAGCDVVVAQGVGAGGHVRGTMPWQQLLDEVRPIVDGLLVVGGGIGTAGELRVALANGADAVRIGTRFLAAAESPAHPQYVDALIAATAADTELTTAFGWGWPDAPHRVLRSCLEAGKAAGDEQRWTPEWPTAHDTGDPSTRALYAGESVGAVTRRESASEILAELVSALDQSS